MVAVLAGFLLAACGAGESKPESQILEERAFEAHSEYLLAEAELLDYRSREGDAGERRAARVRADKLLRECAAAITEEECSVSEPLEAIVKGIRARSRRPSN
jgi:hypothetical protein